MPKQIPEETQLQIRDALLMPDANVRHIAVMFGVSDSTVKNIRRRFNGQTALPGQDSPKKGLIPQPHGGALLPGGSNSFNQKRDRTIDPDAITLTDVCRWFSKLCPEDSRGGTYFDVFMRGVLKNAVSGNQAYASMVFTAFKEQGILPGESLPNAGGTGSPMLDGLSEKDALRLYLSSIDADGEDMPAEVIDEAV